MMFNHNRRAAGALTAYKHARAWDIGWFQAAYRSVRYYLTGSTGKYKVKSL